MATNQLSATGLTVQSQLDIVSDLTTGLLAIYGADVNLDSNTPDGQMINIYATALEDNLQLLVSAYNQLSLTNAFGVQVDNLVALNGIQRLAGTFTIAQVVVTVSQALTLPGLDVLVGNPNAIVFTVSDQAGNQYRLMTSFSFGSAGTQTLAFEAVNIGQVLTSANTITILATPLLGVTSVNNPSTSSDIIGTNEETDNQLKIRQAQSFQLGSTGPADTIRAQLLNTPGIVDAFVPENDTSSVVAGVPANGIWVIVNNATATSAQIAQVIYTKKSAGTAQKTGAGQSFNITRPAGNVFTAYWDLAIQEQLYISFQINPINGVDTFNNSQIASQLAAALTYRLNQSAFVGQVISAMNLIAPNAFLTSVFVDTHSSPAQQQVSPSDFQHYFFVMSSNITIT